MASQKIEEYMRQIQPMPTDLTVDEVFDLQMQQNWIVEKLPCHASVSMERRDCDGVRTLWFQPENARTDCIVLYCHGGAYILGSAMLTQGLISRLAHASGIPVVALDYQLAPKSAFPTQVDEGYNLYSWLLRNGFNASQIAFAGDSAGGGLVMSICHKIGLERDALPACVAASSPWTDLCLTGESIDTVAYDPCVTREGLEFARELFLQGKDPADPLASPLFGPFSGFPPLLIQVGSRERLLSDATRVAAKADSVGVDVTLSVFDRCPHLWHWWVPDSEEGRAAVDEISAFLCRYLFVSKSAQLAV